MQTGREAIDNLMRKKTADFVPMHDNPWGDTIEKWVTQGMPTDEDGKPVDSCAHFDDDMAGCGGWFRWAAKPPEQDEVIEETDEWKVTRNGNGAALKRWKHKSGTPEHVDFHMTSRKIWDEEYRPLLVGADPAERVANTEDAKALLARRRVEGRWAHFGGTFVWEIMRGSLGDVNMFMTFADDPDWLHDFNRVYTDLIIRCYTLLFKEAGTPDGIWVYEDLGYRDRLFCSPEMLKDLFMPYYTELIAFFHSYDLPVVLHSCGYQEPMIPLAIEAGFDALNPMEAKAGNDTFKYAEQYGDDLCFVGGLDARVLESGDRPAIKRAVTDIITGMRERGARYVYGSDHSLSTNIDYEDFLYSLEVYRELR